MQTKLLEQLSAADAAIILERLPERIRAAMIDRANEIEYPTALVAHLRDRSYS
jgi:3-hydroxymyristoyl/3-hydroxydecanoyl-(acyl carrier protein) dehydratase